MSIGGEASNQGTYRLSRYLVSLEPIKRPVNLVASLYEPTQTPKLEDGLCRQFLMSVPRDKIPFPRWQKGWRAKRRETRLLLLNSN